MLQPYLELKSLGWVLKVNCISYMHVQDSDCSGTSSISELGVEQEFGVNAQGLTLNIYGNTDIISLSGC